MLRANETYRVLGTFDMGNPDYYDTINRFERLYPECLTGFHQSMRGPLDERLITAAEEWHHDLVQGDSPLSDDGHIEDIPANYVGEMITWTNKEGTLFRDPTDPEREWQSKPNEVVLFNNRLLEHKPPSSYLDPDRYLIRAAALEGFTDVRNTNAIFTSDEHTRREAA